jgi:hypothetical protein
MLIWLICSTLKLLRKISLTLDTMAVIVAFFPSAAISVNITPTTEVALYQPGTSVSRVSKASVPSIFVSTISLLDEGSESLFFFSRPRSFCEMKLHPGLYGRSMLLPAGEPTV